LSRCDAAREFVISIAVVTSRMIRKTVLPSGTLSPSSSASCTVREFPSFVREATLGADRGIGAARIHLAALGRGRPKAG
jgi:hypothetical protein